MLPAMQLRLSPIGMTPEVVRCLHPLDRLLGGKLQNMSYTH
jgi:hypothetical protein